MKNLIRWLMVVGIAAGITASAQAQKSPKENSRVWLGFHASVNGAASDYAFRIQSSKAGEADPYYAWMTNWVNNSTTVESPNVMTNLTPGRVYWFSTGCGSWHGADVHFNPPPGYTLYIGEPYLEMTPRLTIASPDYGTSYGTYSFNIMLLPNDAASILPGGYAAPPTLSAVTWGVSGGSLSNGRSAGALRWRISSVSQDLLDAAVLDYSDFQTTETFTWTYSDGAIKYLATPTVQLYVRRHTGTNTGYIIEAYAPDVTFSYAGGDPANDWTFGSAAFATYDVTNPDTSWLGRVRITRVQDSNTETWTLGVSGGNTTLEQTSSSRTLRLVSTAGPGTGQRTEVATAEDANGTAVKTQRIYQNYVWNEELISETADPDGLALTTTYDYYTSGWTSGAFSGNVTKLKSITRPDGSWEKYEYSEDFDKWGQLVSVYRPWKDDAPTSVSSATQSNCRVTNFSYNGERSVFHELPAGSEEKIMGTTTARTTSPSGSLSIWSNSYYNVYPSQIQQIRSEAIRQYSDNSTYTETIRSVFHNSAVAAYRGKLYSQINPDGTKVSAAYVRGNWTCYFGALVGSWTASSFSANSAGAYWCESYLQGASTAITGSEAVSSMYGMPIDTVYMVPYRSTRRDVLRQTDGAFVYDVTYLYTGSGAWQLLSWNEKVYGNGSLLEEYDSTGRHPHYSYIGGHCNYETHPDGTEVQYFFDDLMRVIRSERKAVAASGSYPAQSAVETEYTYDAGDHVVATTTYPYGGGVTLTTSATYNQAGLVTGSTDERGLSTSIAYTNGGRTVTTTLPGSATKVTDRYYDGQVKSVTGTSLVASYSDVTVNTDGTLTSTSHLASSSSARWSSTTTDWMGRKIKEEHPASSSGTFSRQFYYNSAGQLYKTTETGLADTLQQYDALGELEFAGLDINGNGSLDLAGTDRVSRVREQFVYQDSAWWRQSLKYVYNQASNSTAQLQSESLTKILPYAGSGTDFSNGVVYGESRSYDLLRNLTTTQTVVNRSTKFSTVTTNVPDSSVDVVSTSYNGRAVSTQSAQNLTSYIYYDALGRQVKQTDPRTDTSSTARIGYYTSGTGAVGQVEWRDDAVGNRTSYTYESSTGRLATVTDPLGKVVRYSYNDRGQTVHTWGDTAYPVEYGYNSYGEQTTMNTYRGGSGWTGSSWPGSPGTADATTWAYEASTGLLLTKTDAASKAVTYTYNARGQLASRAWARGVTATYSYDSSTAEQTGIDYSDSTPDLTYTYNRMGQTGTVTDVTGTRTFSYNATGTFATLLDREILDSSYLQGRAISRQRATSGVIGRDSGFTITGPSNTGTEAAIGYGYDTYGRFNAINNGHGIDVTYSYTSGSNLIAAISATSGWTETMTYEAHRDLMTSIVGQYGSTVKAQFDYAYDTLGRRTSVTDSGEIFSRYSASALTTRYAYNDRSEVTEAKSYNTTNPADTSSPLLGRSFTYDFDNIGSRTTSAVDGSSTSYTNNALNQLTARAAPSSTDVTGLAPASATVTVNGSTASRQGDYYYKNVAAGSTPLWQSLTASSSLGGSFTRSVYVPTAPQNFTYDDDGNLTDDGRWYYTWDAENRLVSMETTSAAALAGVPKQFISFKYDYLGRRVRKTVSNWNGSTYAAATDRKFIYDGWNLAAEHDALATGTPAVQRFVWGLDLTGTVQDGGGVGGLLGVIEVATSVTHLAAYDGNGNVHALINRTSGVVTASYEYSAFGETLRATGAFAASNPIRFSSKYTDTDTGLLYYGYRYYAPIIGRWLGRDPLEEKGGLNLYAFVRNNPVNAWDILGRDAFIMYIGWDYINNCPILDEGDADLSQRYSNSLTDTQLSQMFGMHADQVMAYVGDVIDKNEKAKAQATAINKMMANLNAGAAESLSNDISKSLSENLAGIEGAITDALSQAPSPSDAAVATADNNNAAFAAATLASAQANNGLSDAAAATTTDGSIGSFGPVSYSVPIVNSTTGGGLTPDTGPDGVRFVDNTLYPTAAAAGGDVIRLNPVSVTATRVDQLDVLGIVATSKALDRVVANPRDGKAWGDLLTGGFSLAGGTFTADQAALIDLAKLSKKIGLNHKQAETLMEWAKELGVPFRGVEIHPNRPVINYPHIHIGPVDHIPVRPPPPMHPPLR